MEKGSGQFLLNPVSELETCPVLKVGIMDSVLEVNMQLKGVFILAHGAEISGMYTARPARDSIDLIDEKNSIVYRGESIRLENKGDSTFTLFDVLIGINFHWEKKEIQSFRGDLLLKKRPEGTIAIINEIGLEDYLESVVSSEMSGNAPFEFLKAHAIISRSWAISTLKKKQMTSENKIQKAQFDEKTVKNDEIIRWYEQEGHSLYDICADDHCQRYQGITKILSENPVHAVKETSGIVLTYKGNICDTRYSKACGGITDEYRTAWGDMDIPYLKSVSDGINPFKPLLTEHDVTSWVHSRPDAFCNVNDVNILKAILADFDLKTEDFFRWKVTYSRKELEEIISRKLGHDLGTLKMIRPLKRGPSGRIHLLEIVGSKKTVRVGKELEIRRWLSNTHLLSSAFVVETKRNKSSEVEAFTLYGAGWGHGVGLCQIGAGVMALKGYSAEEILTHYFPDSKLEKVY